MLTHAVFISTPSPRTPLPGPVCLSLVGTDPWDARMAGGLKKGIGRVRDHSGGGKAGSLAG